MFVDSHDGGSNIIMYSRLQASVWGQKEVRLDSCFRIVKIEARRLKATHNNTIAPKMFRNCYFTFMFAISIFEGAYRMCHMPRITNLFQMPRSLVGSQ